MLCHRKDIAYIIMAFVKESIIYNNDTGLFSDSILCLKLQTFEYHDCYFAWVLTFHPLIYIATRLKRVIVAYI